MDREKVIEGLEFTKAMITFNPSTGEDIEPGNLNEEDKTTYDACVGAIALLKEQEAMKPIYSEEKFCDFLPHCPVCKKVLPNISQYGKSNFCHVCGQAVKWE